MEKNEILVRGNVLERTGWKTRPAKSFGRIDLREYRSDFYNKFRIPEVFVKNL